MKATERNDNSGDGNSGYFNSDTPDTIRVFGKPCGRVEWMNAYKPAFLFFEQVWITKDEISDDEKAAHPESETTGGYLKSLPYKEAFKRSWENADPEDRIRIKDLPNFDAEIFFAISGIWVE